MSAFSAVHASGEPSGSVPIRVWCSAPRVPTVQGSHDPPMLASRRCRLSVWRALRRWTRSAEPFRPDCALLDAGRRYRTRSAPVAAGI